MRSFNGEVIDIDDSYSTTPTVPMEDARRKLFSPMACSTPRSAIDSNSYVEMSSINWRDDELKIKCDVLASTIASLEHSLAVLKAQHKELNELM
ncbi:hypothetical protein ACF0H5_017824 [Mactra antiquata]